MKENQIFSFKRFKLILRHDVYTNARFWRVILFVLGAYLLIYLLKFGATLLSFNNVVIGASELGSKFYAGFFISGIVIAGTAFNSFRLKLTTQNYLMLPASKLEKFLSQWLLTGIAYVIIYPLAFLAFNILVWLFGLFFGVDVTIYNFLTDGQFWNNIVNYFILQSILLAGAATFEKSPLLKTPLIALLVIFGLSFTLGIVSFLIFHSFGIHVNINQIPNNFNTDFLKIILDSLKILTPFVFWTITYFKLTEKEA